MRRFLFLCSFVVFGSVFVSGPLEGQSPTTPPATPPTVEELLQKVNTQQLQIDELLKRSGQPQTEARTSESIKKNLISIERGLDLNTEYLGCHGAGWKFHVISRPSGVDFYCEIIKN